jgi:hypothetical protein
MTAYFDRMDTRLDALREAGKTPYCDEVLAFQKEIIRDVLLAVEFGRRSDGTPMELGGDEAVFPSELRDAAYKALIVHFPAFVDVELNLQVELTVPIALNGNLYGDGSDDDHFMFAQIKSGIGHLHSIFHAAARTEGYPYGDRIGWPHNLCRDRAYEYTLKFLTERKWGGERPPPPEVTDA